MFNKMYLEQLEKMKKINKYLTATILTVVSGGAATAQTMKPTPKLVVNITIDQLRTDYIEAFSPYYGDDGFKKLFKEGVVYHHAQCTYAPVDRASSMASAMTGTAPSNHGITGRQWLDKESLVPVDCTYDRNYEGIFTNERVSPKNLATSTINDELKMATDGKALVYSFAFDCDMAVMGGGHAADGVFWFNRENGTWCSSKYYYKKPPKWIETYNILNVNDFNTFNANTNVTNVALLCINSTEMGMDGVTDMLNVSYIAQPAKRKGITDKEELQNTYIQLDRELEKLTTKLESKFGKDNVLFVVMGTGCFDEDMADYAKYRIPSGTFFINRTASLLNMYLSAIYGQDKYVEAYFYNQIFLNFKDIEMKRLNMVEILERSQAFLIQNAGVKNAFTRKDLLFMGRNGDQRLRNWYNATTCGDLVVEVIPGWRLFNEDNKQQYLSRENVFPFPIIFYGAGQQAQEVIIPVTTDRIAPTIAKAIRIRAPNACASSPLF